jgi:cytochrome b subunit of formate dehydrogenase
MMRGTKSQNRLKKTVIWLLAIVLALYGISGFGITEFRTVETLTFGLLTKKLAFKIHNSLGVPFITLLVLHLCLPFVFRLMNRKDAYK